MRSNDRAIGGRPQSESRHGAIAALSAVLMVVMIGFVALSVDLGNIELTRTQLQSAADAAALAAAIELSGTDTPDVVRANAKAAAVAVAALHRSGDRSSVTIDPVNDITFGKLTWNAQTQTYQYAWGNGQTPYNVVKVQAMRTLGTSGDNRLPLFFAPVIGSTKADVGAVAVASFQPRDIMVVLDLSASMNDDSTFFALSKLGQSAIESSLQTMYTELGSPVYGNLTFTPKYATLKGRTASGTIPHIDVTFKRTSVGVTSTLALAQVRLQFSDSTTQTITVSGSILTGTYAGTGSNANKTITSCWVKSGTNASLSSGNYGEQFDFTAANIKTALGLTGTYPYPGGSWSEYITYVQASSGNLIAAGYRDMYGYMTWLDYLQWNRFTYADTPDLWKTSEQPIKPLKDSVGLFIDFLTSTGAQDQVGLSVFTSSSSSGILEQGLTTNLNTIKTITQQRQAGHYASPTNISAGMTLARNELVAHARPRSFRLMVLLTDGQANLPTSVSAGTAAVISEANLAAANNIKILTIALGADADTATLQTVANITGGQSFVITGGQSTSAVSQQLQNVFREIASSRPLKLVSGQ